MGLKQRHIVRGLLALMLALAACSTPTPMRTGLNRVAPPSPVQRCMNLSGALEASYEGEWGYRIRLEDVDRLAAAGFDTIRLPVKWSAHAGKMKPYALDPMMLARTDEIIDYAISRGMNVILNVHHYSEMNKRPRRHERRLLGIWAQLAEHYAGYPDALIFEVLNEPRGAMTSARTDALNDKVMTVIREEHPDRWVVLATADWGSLRGLLGSKPPLDHKTILSLHYYEPFDFTHQGAHFLTASPPSGKLWGKAKEMKAVRRDLGSAADFRDALGAPLLMGEFGVYEDVPLADRARWVKAVRIEAEAQKIGWCHWGYATTFKAYDIEQERWIGPIRAALIDTPLPLAEVSTAP